MSKPAPSSFGIEASAGRDDQILRRVVRALKRVISNRQIGGQRARDVDRRAVLEVESRRFRNRRRVALEDDPRRLGRGAGRVGIDSHRGAQRAACRVVGRVVNAESIVIAVDDAPGIC
jgi:hypothetical protein